MIYTVTLNPALDYHVKATDLVFGKTNYSEKSQILIGGKGINISTVLANLGIESTATGFLAGFTGNYIESELGKHFLQKWTYLPDGKTRINVKLKNNDTETEINSKGPIVGNESFEEFLKITDDIKSDDILVLAGSVPKGLDSMTYKRIIERVYKKQTMTIVDAAKDLLLNTLQYRPFLIKPNKQELEEIFDIKIKKSEEIYKYSEKLIEMGARNVIVSLGGDGAILLTETGNRIYMTSPHGEVVNTIGAGDSLIAGFIYEYLRSGSVEKAFRTGVITGSATAFIENLDINNKMIEDMM